MHFPKSLFGIALPKWIVSEQYGGWVLGFYALIFMIILPVAVVLEGDDEVEVEQQDEDRLLDGQQFTFGRNGLAVGKALGGRGRMESEQNRGEESRTPKQQRRLWGRVWKNGLDPGAIGVNWALTTGRRVQP
uniref:Uncharacterized protein n=1 Tax=Globodera rostochiensis TaxID=31243 RepID=A0A914H9A1_GLORO